MLMIPLIQNITFGYFQKNLMDFLYFFLGFLSIKNNLIRSIFGLEKCSLHENGVQFHQKLIGSVFGMLVRQLLAYSGNFLWFWPQWALGAYRSPVWGGSTAPGGDLTDCAIYRYRSWLVNIPGKFWPPWEVVGPPKFCLILTHFDTFLHFWPI